VKQFQFFKSLHREKRGVYCNSFYLNNFKKVPRKNFNFQFNIDSRQTSNEIGESQQLRKPKYWSNISNISLFVCLQYVILTALLAVANAWHPAAHSLGYTAAPSITSQSPNILRSYGNLGQVSTYSSFRKSDVRVSNDALAYSAALFYTPAPAQHWPLPDWMPPLDTASLGSPTLPPPAVARQTITNG
jgi:hypothetical protein